MYVGPLLRRTCAAALTALMISSGAAAEKPLAQGAPLTVGHTIGDLLNHPGFAGFARRILPWSDRDYALDAELSDIAGLLPYHSDVHPQTIVDGLNRMIADRGAGAQVFFEIYSEAERAGRSDLNTTGLFFFRGKPGAPFAVIAPGGGFSYVASVHEGFPYAGAISREGYNAFVLTYRTGRGGGAATRDLAQAIGFIFAHAAELGVGTDVYSLWGSSAGARMAASIGSHGTQAFGGRDLPKPCAVIMAYTGHADHAPEEPPTFVVVGGRDAISPAARMERRVDALRALGTEIEYRRYGTLGHGFGPGTGTSADGWIKDAVRFWEKQMRAAE